MKRRTLGRTGLQVSEVGLGGLFTSSLAGGVEESRAIVRRAVARGVNYIDTAPGYADSEATLGQALQGIEEPLVLSTKLGGRPWPFDPRDAKALAASVDESLRLLGRDVIDVLMIHEPDRPLQYPWWTSHDPLGGPVLKVLQDMKKAGKVRFVGLGGTTVSELAALVRTGLFDVVLTAFNYNALFREAADELIPAAVERGVGIVVGSVLGQGGLGRRFDDEVRRRPNWLSRPRQAQLLSLYEILDDTGLKLPELGLRFALSDPRISSVLIGAKTAAQLEESLDAAERGPLPADVLERLDAIAAAVPFRPFEEPMILPFGKTYFGPGPANVGANPKIGQ